MPQFSKILCPVDFDQSSLAAVRVAADLAWERNANLHLLHVLDREAFSFGKIESAARTKLERISRQKLKAGTRYELLVMIGDHVVEVLQTATRLGIVMATHGRKGLRRLVLGSVAACGSRSTVPGADGQTEGCPCWSIRDAATAKTDRRELIKNLGTPDRMQRLIGGRRWPGR